MSSKSKIDRYNFELYRFKLGAFFSETQCSIAVDTKVANASLTQNQRLQCVTSP